VKINIHLRDCVEGSGELESRCYDRNTDLGYYDTRQIILSHLTFLTPNVVLNSFKGVQCYCQSDMCTPVVSSSSSAGVSIVAMVLTVIFACVLV